MAVDRSNHWLLFPVTAAVATWSVCWRSIRYVRGAIVESHGQQPRQDAVGGRGDTVERAAGAYITASLSPAGCLPLALAALIAGLSALMVTFRLDHVDDKPPREQASYVKKVDHAREQLFRGQLVHTDARSMGLVAGEPQDYRVQVRGSWHPTKTGDAQAPVKAGAQIGVKLRCSGAGVRCTPLSSERQSVLSKSDKANWLWDVNAPRSGKVSMALTVTAYLGDSDTVLTEKAPVTSRFDVPASESPWFSWAVDLWGWTTGSIATLGGLAASVTAIAGVVVMVRRRKLPGEDAGDAGTTEQASGAIGETGDADTNGQIRRRRSRTGERNQASDTASLCDR